MQGRSKASGGVKTPPTLTLPRKGGGDIAPPIDRFSGEYEDEDEDLDDER